MCKKTAIVTGSSRGIGAAIVKRLAQDGFQVMINYKGNEKSAKEVADVCRGYGVSAEIFQADVSDFNQAKALADFTFEKFSSIDVLVNNAGITRDGLLMRMEEAQFTDVVDANLKSAFNMIRHVCPYMIKARSGKIVNMSSIAGIYGNKGQANYSASKAGLFGLTKTAAKELGMRNITVNAIAPGYIQTEMSEILPEKTKQDILSKSAIKRPGQAEEVAYLVSFLAGNLSDFITGQIIGIDGGLVLN